RLLHTPRIPAATPSWDGISGAVLAVVAKCPDGTLAEQRNSEDPLDPREDAGQSDVRPDQRVGGDVHAVAGQKLVVRGRVPALGHRAPVDRQDLVPAPDRSRPGHPDAVLA